MESKEEVVFLNATISPLVQAIQERKQMKQKVFRILSDLGDTPDAIAATLEGNSITGTKGNSIGCPIANFLKKVLGLDYVRVDPISIATRDDYFDYDVIPLAVACFINRFDRDEYPQLEEGESKWP